MRWQELDSCLNGDVCNGNHSIPLNRELNSFLRHTHTSRNTAVAASNQRSAPHDLNKIALGVACFNGIQGDMRAVPLGAMHSFHHSLTLRSSTCQLSTINSNGNSAYRAKPAVYINCQVGYSYLVSTPKLHSPLSRVQDTLLPHLIPNQLRLPEAQELVGKALP